MRMKPFVLVALLSCLWIGLAVGETCRATEQRGGPEGGTIELTVGQTHTITLASNPTTGYRWQLASPLGEGILKLVGSEYRKPDSKLLGAGGSESWIFRAVGKGQTTIVMIYVRPWEKDGKAARSASFNLIVK